MCWIDIYNVYLICNTVLLLLLCVCVYVSSSRSLLYDLSELCSLKVKSVRSGRFSPLAWFLKDGTERPVFAPRWLDDDDEDGR